MLWPRSAADLPLTGVPAEPGAGKKRRGPHGGARRRRFTTGRPAVRAAPARQEAGTSGSNRTPPLTLASGPR